MTNGRFICFRADANSAVGFGHFFRILAIHSYLRTYFTSRFFVQTDQEFIRKQLFSLDARYEPTQDADVLLFNAIGPSSIVVLDGYQFDTIYQLRVKHTGATLISIDDSQPFHYVSDVVVNHAKNLTPGHFSVEPSTRLCLGFDYLMLRESFFANGRIVENHSWGRVDRIFCSFGGTSQNAIVGSIIEAISGVMLIEKIDIIGKRTGEQKQAQPFEINYHEGLTEQQMASLMRSSQLAIVPASNISLECFACDMPILTGMTALNQTNVFQSLGDEPGVWVLGDWHNASPQDIASALRSITRAMKVLAPIRRELKSKDNFVSLFSTL